MSASIPAWARALLLVDRGVHSAVRLAALVRSELLLAGLDPAQWEAVTAEAFAKEDTYAPGGPAFARGLFAWERAALTRPPFPTSGRILLGGAGGGRELAGLQAMGYDVVAFEPAGALANALAEVAAAHPGTRTARGSYADLVRAAAGNGGPLADLVGEPFDAVVLGWASLSHVTRPADRLALFEALRTLAPSGPVLLSYLGADDDGRANGRVEALRAPVRRLLARAVRKRAAAEGLGFIPEAGFYQRFAAGEIEALAGRVGYDIAHHALDPYPHAVLTPRAR